MIELEKLSAEKQEELLEVIKYFNNDKNKFEKEFDLLNIEDKKTIISYIMDDYDYLDDQTDDYNKNKDIIDFLKKDKYQPILINMYDAIESDIEQEKIKKETKLSIFNKKYPELNTKISEEEVLRYLSIIFGGDFDENFKKLSKNDKLLLSYVMQKTLRSGAINYLSKINKEIDEYLIDARLI
jgi:hypothetical protein